MLSFALLTSALLTVFFSTRAPAADGHLVIVAADDLTAAQIVAIRRRMTDFAVARGWVND